MVGDVFTIPLDDDRVGLGQVVGTYRVAALYLAVFDRFLPRDVAPAVAIGSAHGPLLEEAAKNGSVRVQEMRATDGPDIGRFAALLATGRFAAAYLALGLGRPA